MTTKVHIIPVPFHEAVIVEAFSPSTGQRLWTQPKVLKYHGDLLTEYVHSGMSLIIREQTPEEKKLETEPAVPVQK